ncbi:MAG: CBS domain-containing protein [Deltaproteobacteria bacterium]|nr:CBS domain-containing protein [Deltaproteobacteria bacterium]
MRKRTEFLDGTWIERTEVVRVREIMSRPVITARAHDPLSRAEELMRTHGLRHVPVVDARNTIIGVVSRGDLLSAGPSSVAELTGQERASFNASVQLFEVMCRSPRTVSELAEADDAASLMLDHHLGCLPVTDESGKVIGILTESDFVRVARDLLRTKSA